MKGRLLAAGVSAAATLWVCFVMYCVAKDYVDPYLRRIAQHLDDWYHQPVEFPRVGQLGRDVRAAVDEAHK